MSILTHQIKNSRVLNGMSPNWTTTTLHRSMKTAFNSLSLCRMEKLQQSRFLFVVQGGAPPRSNTNFPLPTLFGLRLPGVHFWPDSAGHSTG